jgi:hypothetical protein
MKMSAERFPVLFAAVLVAVATAAFAQNIASSSGSWSRNTDHLTLLPGPGLLSPARGAGVPSPVAEPGPASFRFLPAKVQPITQTPPILLRRTGDGTLTLSSNPSAIPPRPTLRHAAAPPSPEALRFRSALEKLPTSLPLKSPPPLRRD